MRTPVLIAVLISATIFNYLAAQSTSPAPYCVADFDDYQGDVPDAINSVSFGSLTNASNAQYAFPHYVFYNNLSVPDVAKGSAHTLTVIFDVNGGCGYGVWIDYNHNNTFEASEKVSGTTVGTHLDFPPNTTITETVTIPTNALTGNTRMRVRIVEDDNYTFGANGYSIMPCNASTSSTDVMDWGETEDYVINITSTTGLNEVHQTNDLIIYPNPITTTLNFKEELSAKATYKILSVTGQEVRSGTIGRSEKQIDVSALAGGTYFFQLNDGDRSFVQQKFVKSAQ